jgi:hypothetical protein
MWWPGDCINYFHSQKEAAPPARADFEIDRVPPDFPG